MATTDRAYLGWVAACAVAETVGMAAAAAAARVAQHVGSHGWALAVVVAGGLVEGSALGLLQGRVLGGCWPALRRTHFLAVTVLVAGVGWAAASAPSVLGGDDTGAGPPLPLVALGGLGLGLVLGPVLGAAQAFTLHGVVAHPRRWTAANAAAWPFAMAVIFAGASSPGPGWSTLAVTTFGAGVGAVAGTALGVVSGAWLGSLDGQPVVNRIVLALLARRRFGLDRRVLGLAVTGRRSGRVARFPVQHAAHGTARVVVPGRADRKVWWRNVAKDPTAVEVLTEGGWHRGTARLLLPGDAGYEALLASYRRRWNRFTPAARQPVVLVDVVGEDVPGDQRARASISSRRASTIRRRRSSGTGWSAE